jgi:pimeloyl-ACP methyl ester carboxylesterase
MNSNTTNSVNIQTIPLEKVPVGDIDIAYKMFGKCDPILLFNGLSDGMDAWPSFLKGLSSNHTVIVFDSRGIGNTTASSKPYTIQLLANDTAGLMDALKIQQANAFGYSMGGIIDQQVAVTHPEKFNRLILVATTCGGKESIPPSPQLAKLGREVINKLLNNIPITPQEIKLMAPTALGPAWIKLHPESLETLPEAKDLHTNIPLNTLVQQCKVVENWRATNWSGICDELSKISNPTLIITETDDFTMAPANSLILAGKIPEACLVQIKDAGHAVMVQYPDEISKILNTFISTTSQNK